MGMVSALIEAKKFKAENGLMLVHSFSRINEGFDDYIQFLALFDFSRATRHFCICPVTLCFIRFQNSANNHGILY